MIQRLWDRQVEAIIQVKIGGAHKYYYKYEPIAALLSRWETIKKDKHGNNCNDQRMVFTICYFSQWNARDIIPGRARAIESKNGGEKGWTPFTHRGWINGRIKIAVAEYYSCMIQRARIPRPPRDRDTDWNPESGIRNCVGRLKCTHT